MLSIVIPTLNAAETLPNTLAALARAAAALRQIVVVDGGSTDDTCKVATAAGADVLTVPPGRGAQLAAGARAASGDWLLFLHADTVLADGWAEAVTAFMGDPDNDRRAAAFRFALDDDTPAARRLERMVGWRNRRLALPYGDQGLLISRAFYDALGGYAPIPLMEDVDIIRRIGRRRLVVFDVPAVTSALRYRRGGYVVRPLRNLLCLALFVFGVPPRWIVRIYR